MWFDVEEELIFDPFSFITESEWYKNICDILWGDGPIITDGLVLPPFFEN